MPMIVPMEDLDECLMDPHESPNMELNIVKSMISFPLPIALACAPKVVLVLGEHAEDVPFKIF